MEADQIPGIGEQVGAVTSVQIGAIAPLGPGSVLSGFVKSAVEGPVAVRELGLYGDEQADLRVHGGLEKAVYGYAASNYEAWRGEFAEHRELLHPGAFGENLTIDGIAEPDISVGDVHAIGSARLQVCQPRQPCFKFALRFNDNRMPKAMVRSGRAGWYYRVLEPGSLQAGDAIELVDRPHPELRFDRLVEIVNRRNATEAELTQLASANGAARWLRSAAEDALSVRPSSR